MKKYISIILLALFAVVNSAAQNVVSLSSGQGTPGDIVTVDVALQNSDEVTAVEVVIPLVEKQLTYVDGSCVINSERANGHSLNAAVVDGALKIYIYNISLAPLKGDDGQIASFSLKLGKLPAEYPLQPQVVLSDATGKALPVTANGGEVTILAPQIEVVTKTVDFGHVPIMSQYTKTLTLRNSGTLPLEVTGIEFSAPEFTATETSFTIAVGATKSISVAYSPTKRGAIEESVTIISDAVNGKATAALVADPYSVNELHSNRVEGIAGEEVTVELRMNNMEPIVGLQTTFDLPEQLVYVEGSFAATERAATHTAVATAKDGKLTLFLYSSKNTPITGNDGVVATFRLRLAGHSGYYSISPLNTVLSNAEQENMTSAVSGEYIVIKSPAIDGSKELSMGRTSVTEKATAQYTVRNNGNAPLVLNSVAFLAEGYRVMDELPITVGDYSSAVLNVEYTPVKEGMHSTIMNIYSNDPVNKLKSVQVSGEIFEPNNLTFEGENLQNGDYVVNVGLENYTGIVALQMDIHWMPGMTTSSDRLKVSERLAGHSCSITKIDDDTYRFIAFSFSNKAIEGNTGKLFELTYEPGNGVAYKDTPILIDNVVLSSSGANNYTSQLTLNAKAEYTHYSVHFICESEVVGESFQRAGTPIVLPDAPKKPAYRFVGWSGAPELMPAMDIEVEAEYERVYEVEFTMGKNGSTTFCSEHPLDFSSVEGLKVYAATGYNTMTGVITMTRMMTSIESTGLFVIAEPGTYTIPVIEHSFDNSLNMLVGVLEKTVVKNYSADGVYANYRYMVKSGTTVPMFYQSTASGASVSAGKAYLQIPVRWFSASPEKSVSLRFDDGEKTDIDEVKDEDGKINAIYDLQGRKVENPTNGIYFIDGRKVIVK